MAKPKLQQTLVDGTDVSSFVMSWKIDRRKDGAITQAVVRFNNNIKNTISFDEDNAFHSITIKRGVVVSTEKTIFKGEIYTFTTNGSVIECRCKCELNKAVRAEVTKSFDKDIDSEAGKPSAIFSTLMTTYAGLTATVGDSVTDSGSINTIEKFICNHADVFERCEKLRELLDWQFYYNPQDDKVYFEQQGTSASTVTLQVGTNVVNSPVWIINTDNMINKYTIVGGEELVEKEETFDGDGSTVAFTLANTPVGVRVEVGGTLKVGGNDTTTGSFDYSVDPDTKKITFEVASTPGAGSNNVKVIYTHFLPRPVVNSNPESISVYGTRQKTDFVTELKNVTDVKNYCKKYVSIYSLPFLTTSLQVINAEDVFPGQVTTVIDGVNSKNLQMYITSVSMVYPYTADVINVGDEELRTKPLTTTISDRLRRLEEETGKNTDKLTHLFDSTKTIKYKKRYFRVDKRSISGTNIFILGNPTYGIIGTSKLGATDLGATATTQLIQGNNEYREFCYDNVFSNGTSSTATFNTSTKKITFTSGQVWYSGVLFLGTSYSWATLTCSNTTGTLLYEVSADGQNNWQTLTSTTRTQLTNTDTTGVVLRITENGSSTAEVDRTTDAFGRQTLPAISLLMEV